MPQSRIRARSAASAGGGSGGATTFNQYASFLRTLGPASYATGGFVVDLSATYSTLNHLAIKVRKGTRGNVPFGRLRVRLNTPTPGKATVLVLRQQQVTTTAFATASGQPAGVTILGASGGTVAAEAAHTHSATHDHAVQASSGVTAGGTGGVLDTLGPSINVHAHNVDLPSMVVVSGAGTSHNHTDNTIYEHAHVLTHTVTALTETELAAATNLSQTTFFVAATGVRA